MSSPSQPTPPPGMTAGMPPGPPLAKPPAGAPTQGGPPGAMPPGMRPGMPQKMMSAKPYIGRALRLLSEHKALTAVTMLLSLLVPLFPLVVSVAFASIFQILGQFAAPLPPGARNAAAPV